MIDVVCIDNFKSIKTVELSLDKINVFIGGNGAGKSHLIEFFHLLRMLQQNRLVEYVVTRGMAHAFLHHDRQRSAHLSGTITFRQQNKQASNLYHFTLVPTDDDKLILKEERAGYKASGSTDFDIIDHKII